MKGNISHTETELFTQISQGDEQAYRTIFHEYNARLFHTIYKLIQSKPEAEEIMQEVFLRLWLHRTILPTLDNPGAWLHTVASNLTLDALRKQARLHRHVAFVAQSATEVHAASDPRDALEVKEIQLFIQEAISLLPAARKEIFLLSKGRGLSRKDIAAQLKISESTVKNQLTAALKQIQSHLKEKGITYLPAFVILIVA